MINVSFFAKQCDAITPTSYLHYVINGAILFTSVLYKKKACVSKTACGHFKYGENIL